MNQNRDGTKIPIYRHQMVIFTSLFISYVFYYLMRKSFSLILPELLITSIIDQNDAGIILSAQSISYTISKFIGGILSDRISAKILFINGLFLSSLTTVLFAFGPQTMTSFTILWFLNGLAQGLGWPSLVKILQQWTSSKQFGTYYSVLSASANVSGGLSPLLATLMTRSFGWQNTLISFGVVSVFISMISSLMISNCPEDIGLAAINQETVKMQESSIKWKELMKSPFIWLLSISYLVVFAAKTTACDWGQLYLIDERQKSQLIASTFTSSVESGGFFGAILAGYLSDRLIVAKKTKSSNCCDRLPVATAMMALSTFALHSLCFHVDSSTSHLFIAILGFILGLAFYGPIIIFGMVATEAVPTNLSGTSHAIVALAANIGAIISGLPFTMFAQLYSWKMVFFLLELSTASIVLLLAITGHRLRPDFAKKND
ncbi:glucose-6-phosphate translocase-like protein [Euroglyphus maynei]|uniref:Glucose-6-phosphate translocase-like protein n=1 Tax=Euroglyphus maynei TaxID=6958 RepID=A0A1Y3AQU2_EURMA|nr:glucose-6-phosphate translocase-like protein [Euroglyphus maynei]